MSNEKNKYYSRIIIESREKKMKITDGIFYVGVNDHEVTLFEGQYQVPNGMAYNSYEIGRASCRERV